MNALEAYLVDQRLPKESVVVHTLGTAGMRLLSDEQNRSINASVAQTLGAGGFRTGRTATISGATLDVPNPTAALLEKVTQTCTGTDAWPRVRALHGGSKSTYAQNACANATYVHAYLFGADSLHPTPEPLTVVPDIAGQSLTWTRGAALLEAVGSPG